MVHVTAMTDIRNAERLNQDCSCITLDRAAVQAAFLRDAGDADFGGLLRGERQHLFSNVSVFLSDRSLGRMRQAVEAIEAVAAQSGYLETVMAWAPAIARNDHGPAGAFMGYDFHIGTDGPRLIEINTNAGGALLNMVLAGAQRACCATGTGLRPSIPDHDFGAAVVGMFEEEWRLQRGHGRPGRIAIVDDNPEDQYLYPEFILARALLERHGIAAVVADPAQLAHQHGKLVHGGKPVDLVYNRLVDFSLSNPRHAALRDAYVGGNVVLTPNPHVHARLADKRNLTVICDPVRLAAWGTAPSDIELLGAVVPKTILVTHENAGDLWAARRRLFFKPAAGYGSRAAYRGAKLTRTVWAEIIDGDYVAQEYAPPSRRMVRIDGSDQPRKMDVRLYTYRGKILLAAARLYQGQTTNFRTEGGGFAPVLPIPEKEQADLGKCMIPAKERD